MADCKAKGRVTVGDRNGFRIHPESIPKGEMCGASKLKSGDVIEIRRAAASGLHFKAISSKHGVSVTNIYHIVKRDTWRHV
jgi:hypothetical protein